MNKILAIQALELYGELVIGMGPQTRIQIPQMLPPVLAALADSKNTGMIPLDEILFPNLKSFSLDNFLSVLRIGEVNLKA